MRSFDGRVVAITGAGSGGKPRVLVGLDAHVLHQFARIVGARYQDVVARRAARTRP